VGGAQHCLSRPKHGEITASLRVDAKVFIRPPNWLTGSARHCPNTATRGAAGSEVHCLRATRTAAGSLPRAATQHCPIRVPLCRSKRCHKRGWRSAPERRTLSPLLVNRRNQIGRCLSFVHTRFHFFQVTRVRFARSDEIEDVYRYTFCRHTKSPMG